MEAPLRRLRLRLVSQGPSREPSWQGSGGPVELALLTMIAKFSHVWHDIRKDVGAHHLVAVTQVATCLFKAANH